MKFVLFALALFAVTANAASVPAAALLNDHGSTAPMIPVEVVPSEMLGMLVCSMSSPTTCGEMKGFTAQEYKFADYVRMKVQNVNARIIGMQYDSRNDKLFLYFAVPEE